MAKRIVLTVCSWLNLVFLGHLLLLSVTVKPGTSSQTHQRRRLTRWQRGRSRNFNASRRLPGLPQQGK